MGLVGRVGRKFQERGFRGLLAGALRRAARGVEPGSAGERRGETAEKEYLAWVRFAVPGMLEPGNLQAMEHAVTNMPADKPILEIGSFCGLSTVILCYLRDKFCETAEVFSCDKWEFEGQKPGVPLGDSLSATHDTYRTHVRNSFLSNLRTFSPHRLPYTIECFSDDFFERWVADRESIDVFGRTVRLGGELGFCYIDGNHSYEFAERDFRNAHRVLARGGFLLFDDSADGSGWEVNRLVREIADDNQYELVSRAPNYLFRKR